MAQHFGPRSGITRPDVGRIGEDLAASHVISLGWTLLYRNWRCSSGEIDLVARESRGTVVLIEVKCRTGGGFGSPLEAITRRKQEKLRELVCEYRQRHRYHRSLRVDAIGVRLYGEDARVMSVDDRGSSTKPSCIGGYDLDHQRGIL